jgi:hypothetical protein
VAKHQTELSPELSESVLPDGLHIFKPNPPILVTFGGPWNGQFCFISWPFVIFYFHSVNLSYGRLV